jgi:hypothetical protein
MVDRVEESCSRHELLVYPGNVTQIQGQMSLRSVASWLPLLGLPQTAAQTHTLYSCRCVDVRAAWAPPRAACSGGMKGGSRIDDFVPPRFVSNTRMLECCNDCSMQGGVLISDFIVTSLSHHVCTAYGPPSADRRAVERSLCSIVGGAMRITIQRSHALSSRGRQSWCC